MEKYKNILTMKRSFYLIMVYAMSFGVNMFPMVQTKSQREMGKMAVKAMIMKKPSNLSLEKLVLLFNKISRSRKEDNIKRGIEAKIFIKIDEIVKKILEAILFQYQIDHKLPMAYLDPVSYSPAYNAQHSLFRNYTGKMISIRSGYSVIYIPDYKVLVKLDKRAEKLMIERVGWSSYWDILNELKKAIPENFLNVEIDNLTSNDSREDVIGFFLKALQNSYDALSWRRRWLQLPW